MSTPSEPTNGSGPGRLRLLSSVLAWLSAGYPQGVPPQDRFPLIALLRPKLTDEQVKWVAEQIADNNEVSRADVQVLITKVTDEMPSEADVERVRRRLTAAGVDADWTPPTC
ncbi:MAG: DUF3349 domain-containing protein [Antricoccus sp.]